MAQEIVTTGRHFKQEPVRQVGFGRLLIDALPEMWSFQIVASIVLSLVLGFLNTGIDLIIDSAGTSLTSANFKEVLLGWRGAVILVLMMAVIVATVTLELFSQIILSNDLLCGRRPRTRDVLKEGLASIKRFVSPSGILVLLYLLVAVPICGVGFSVSLTKDLYVPHFIKEVIDATPLYLVAYWAIVAILAIIGTLHAFVIHGVLVDDLTPTEARRQSTTIVRHHFWALARCVIGVFLKCLFIVLAAYLLFNMVPSLILALWGESLPGARLSTAEFLQGYQSWTDSQLETFMFRLYSCATVILGSALIALVVLLTNSYTMLRITRFYRDYAHEPTTSWPALPHRHRYIGKVALMFGVGVLLAGVSFGLAVIFEDLFYKDPPGIVAHRAGGTLAPENSLQGLEVAIAHGCYGSEIDVQRTSDGYYIINHDDTFARLTGDRRTPQEMTFEEVRALQLRDTTGGDQPLQVATLEEMLDVIKGREKLFIELKGATADKQMVDDVVALVREKDCVGDVVLISLKYDVITYAEKTYPEFDTGVLFYVSVGNPSRLTSDYLLMEEELATNTRIATIHLSEQKVGVWTVNTRKGMRDFLLSDADFIITDRIDMAEEVQAELDDRNDLERVEDALDDMWG